MTNHVTVIHWILRMSNSQHAKLLEVTKTSDNEEDRDPYPDPNIMSSGAFAGGTDRTADNLSSEIRGLSSNRNTENVRQGKV